MRRVRRLLAFAVMAAATCIAAAAAPPRSFAASPDADEYRVKAAVLYNLAKFVDWPADAFPGPAAPLTVCVLGVDPFGPLLEDAFRGHLVAGRPVAVRRIADVSSDCHLLFIAGSERKRMALIADQLRTASVLTVSDQDAFGSSGGMIELFTDGERIRFSINVAALEAARLRASARLREIASNEGRAGGRR